MTALGIIGTWLLFEKAGEKGWKSLIPVYNTYILCKISDKKRWFSLQAVSYITAGVAGFCMTFIVIAFFVALFTLRTTSISDMFGKSYVVLTIFVIAAAFYFASVICSLIVRYQICKGLQHRMQLPTGIVVGLFFVPNVFFFVIGQGQQYVYYRDTTAPTDGINATP
jgi:hypothetical protein